MLVGDPSQWASRFVSTDDRLLARIVAVWPACQAALPANADEDLITRNLVNLLLRDGETREFVHWIQDQFPVWEYTAGGVGIEKGIVDMAVLLDQERTNYLAYECKRLSVIYSNGRQSLAGPYVTEGLVRFVTEQYAEKLPTGAMLGYVLDGDIAFALSRVSTAIQSNRQLVGLLEGPTELPTISVAARFGTLHQRPTGNHQIEVRHAFLPFARHTIV
ncbi:MAG: hypothetical protein M0D54_01910 [Hyphomonadaceae bacterium JAD_PAG50586_4]|nr:MAG: hypothetical protein M0D54_01910 [Hyphomonadaceae bacterium JAD_PAG50586_4]